MHQLFWTPIAINFFIEFLMVALLTGYFAVRLISALPTQVNIRITSCLFATFAAATFGTLLQFLANTLHPDYVDFSLPFVSVLGAIAMSGFLLFTFYFQRQVRTHKWVEICIIVGIFLLVGTESLVALARFRLLSRGIVEYRDYWLSIPYALGFFAAHLILLTRLIETLAHTHHRPRHQCIGLVIQAIVVPSIKLEQQAAALRAFFYMTMIPATIGIVLILRGLGIIDWSVTELMNCWLTLLTYVGFMLVYVNHTPEYSSFQFKLVGITLAVVFSILSGISWVIGQTYINAYQNHQQPAVHSTLHFSPIQDGYSFQQMPYHFRQEIGQKQSLDHALVLPFDFPYYGATYHTLYPQLAGIVGLHDVPRWRDVQHQFGPQPALFPLATELTEQASDKTSGLFYQASAEVAVVTWHRLVSSFTPEAYYTFQLCLYPNGVIEMSYADLPNNYQPTIDYPQSTPMMIGIVPDFANRSVAAIQLPTQQPFTAAPHQGLMAYPYLEFRAYLNQVYKPIAIFILLATFIILIIFPRFFHISLNSPLQAMLEGVREIKAGNLNTPIKVAYHDEIGFLATSFNEMAATQYDLVETLEAKVAIRSAEAAEYAAQYARLEERNHLTRELHDTVSQTLFSANLLADTLPHLWQQAPSQGHDALKQIRQLNKHALIEMQQLLLQLRPEGLSQYSFGQMLQKLVNNFGGQHGTTIALEIASDVILPPNVQLAFFRIAQEALHNIRKHAQAHSVLVNFDGIQGQSMLSISDDGRGFVPEHVAPISFGLRFMHERMTQIGGTFEITSAKGQGTTLTAIWFDQATNN